MLNIKIRFCVCVCVIKIKFIKEKLYKDYAFSFLQRPKKQTKDQFSKNTKSKSGVQKERKPILKMA